MQLPDSRPVGSWGWRAGRRVGARRVLEGMVRVAMWRAKTHASAPAPHATWSGGCGPAPGRSAAQGQWPGCAAACAHPTRRPFAGTSGVAPPRCPGAHATPPVRPRACPTVLHPRTWVDPESGPCVEAPRAAGAPAASRCAPGCAVAPQRTAACPGCGSQRAPAWASGPALTGGPRPRLGASEASILPSPPGRTLTIYIFSLASLQRLPPVARAPGCAGGEM